MSFNVHAAVMDEDTGNVITMTLLRASRGITSTAVLGIGETIAFDGLRAKVTGITHEHAPFRDVARAPNSHAYVEFEHPLDPSEIAVLIQHGFMVEEGE